MQPTANKPTPPVPSEITPTLSEPTAKIPIEIAPTLNGATAQPPRAKKQPQRDLHDGATFPRCPRLIEIGTQR